MNIEEELEKYDDITHKVFKYFFGEEDRRHQHISNMTKVKWHHGEDYEWIGYVEDDDYYCEGVTGEIFLQGGYILVQLYDYRMRESLAVFKVSNMMTKEEIKEATRDL